MSNSGKIDLIIGDSIAVAFYNKRDEKNFELLKGAYASGLNQKTKSGASLRVGSDPQVGITVGGKGTEFFLKNMDTYIKKNLIDDKNILISSGFSNDVGLLPRARNRKVDNNETIWTTEKLQQSGKNIEELFKLIKSAGGNGYVIGVSTYAAFNPGNELLKNLSNKYNFIFLGDFEPAFEGGARVHMKNITNYYKDRIKPALESNSITTATPVAVEKKSLTETNKEYNVDIKQAVASKIQTQGYEKSKEEYLNNIIDKIYEYGGQIQKLYYNSYNDTETVKLFGVPQNLGTLKATEDDIKKAKENIKKVTLNNLIHDISEIIDLNDETTILGIFYEDLLLNNADKDVNKEGFEGVAQAITTVVEQIAQPVAAAAQQKSFLEGSYKYIKETIVIYYVNKLLSKDKADEIYNKIFGENNLKKPYDINKHFKITITELKSKDDSGNTLLSQNIYTPTNDFSTQKTNYYQFCSFGSLFKTFIQSGIGMSTAAYSTTKNNQSDSEVDIQIISYTFNEKAGPILSNLPIMMMPVHLKKFKTEYVKLIFSKKDNYMTIDEFMNFFFESILNDPRSITNPMHVFYNDIEEGDDPIVIDEDGLKKYLTSAETIVIPQICALVETLTEDQINGELLVKEGDKTFSGKNKKILRIHIFDKAKNPYNNIKKINFDDKKNVFIVDEDYGQDLYGEKISPQILETVEFEKGFSNIALRNFLTKKVPVIQIGHTTSNVTSISISSNQNPRDTANRVTQFYKSDTNFGGNLKNNDIFNLPIRIIPANLSMTTVGCPMPEIGQVYYIDLGTGTSLDSLYVVTKVSHTFAQGKFETNLEFVPQDGLAQFEQAIINFKSDQSAPTTT